MSARRSSCAAGWQASTCAYRTCLTSTQSTSARTPVRKASAQSLKEQLYKPVRWADTVRAMLASGVTTFVECGPGKVLTSLNRRIERRADLKMLALEDPASLAAALAACKEYATMLEKELALVTGASRGIGRAIALELGRQGARVIGTATSEAGARAIDEYLAAAGVPGPRHGARRRAGPIGRAVPEGHRGQGGRAVDPCQQRGRHPGRPVDAHECGRTGRP